MEAKLSKFKVFDGVLNLSHGKTLMLFQSITNSRVFFNNVGIRNLMETAFLKIKLINMVYQIGIVHMYLKQSLVKTKRNKRTLMRKNE